MTVKSCLKSMRLRTLPLSLSGVIVGISLASSAGDVASTVAAGNIASTVTAGNIASTVITLILTTIFLQILSNLSNELGDTLHGTDTDDRAGIHYSLQDGDMTIPQMKKLIAAIIVLCCISGLAMIYFSFGTLLGILPISFILLGAAAIWAAMHYTLGKNPYGYRGHGDIFVFIFFGLVSTLGATFICSHTFSWLWLLPASAFGLWSVGVLNVNNIRDMATDAATRTTVAIKLGERNARIYHTILIISGWVLLLSYTIANTLITIGRPQAEFSAFIGTAGWWALQFIYILMMPLSFIHLKAVWTRSGKSLDPMLPMLVLTTFAVSILFCI